MLAYFSTAFFERLLSPQYHIEMRRRLRSAAEIDLVKMARLAAQNEGRPHETIDDLLRADFLPHGFGRRRWQRTGAKGER